MANIESLIVGSEKITTILGYWPSFHDAEILELHFSRGNVQPEKSIFEFPVLTLTLHHWELTKEVNPKGFFSSAASHAYKAQVLRCARF